MAVGVDDDAPVLVRAVEVEPGGRLERRERPRPWVAVVVVPTARDDRDAWAKRLELRCLAVVLGAVVRDLQDLDRGEAEAS